jgi:predicted GNAT family acetyltransferase
MSHINKIKENVRTINNKSWVIEYKGATCKFESNSPEDAVIYDCKVPTDMRGKGIGTAMLKIAEEIVKKETNAKVLYAQIGEDSGETEYVLVKKLNYELITVDEREQLGKVVDAQKRLDST